VRCNDGLQFGAVRPGKFNDGAHDVFSLEATPACWSRGVLFVLSCVGRRSEPLHASSMLVAHGDTMLQMFSVYSLGWRRRYHQFLATRRVWTAEALSMLALPGWLQPLAANGSSRELCCTRECWAAVEVAGASRWPFRKKLVGFCGARVLKGVLTAIPPGGWLRGAECLDDVGP
jgi:hypothetical protein